MKTKTLEYLLNYDWFAEQWSELDHRQRDEISNTLLALESQTSAQPLSRLDTLAAMAMQGYCASAEVGDYEAAYIAKFAFKTAHALDAALKQ